MKRGIRDRYGERVRASERDVNETQFCKFVLLVMLAVRFEMPA